jgi:hypothetical protein
MSSGTACRDPAHRPAWRVLQRKCNHSTFNGRRKTPSDYSEIYCGIDDRYWRSKAAYVDQLPDQTAADLATRALKNLAEDLCAFWACDGPDAPFVSMKTCRVCSTIQLLRTALEPETDDEQRRR